MPPPPCLWPTTEYPGVVVPDSVPDPLPHNPEDDGHPPALSRTLHVVNTPTDPSHPTSFPLTAAPFPDGDGSARVNLSDDSAGAP